MPVMQLHTASEPHENYKPLPTLPLPPSPTLTNPDLVLPNTGLPSISSPPRRPGRPPSPSYLRDPTGSPNSSSNAAMGKKDKLGLMSRKMMLLRSRTNSGNPNSGHSSQASTEMGSMVASSPTLQDVGNLAPEKPEGDHLRPPRYERRTSGSGSSSSDLSALNGFLAKYTENISASDDDADDTDPQAHQADSGHGDDDLEAKRRIQAEEEYQSAILSKRAEQILANAKKRLNVMEGNLRGARDLVAPLTAANLKRATSLGSAHYMPAYTRRMDAWGFGVDDASSTQPRRRLQTQASSPSMGFDYANHGRGLSAELPERSQSALDQQQLTRAMRAPVRAAEPSWIQGLRGSRSYEALGQAVLAQGTSRDRPRGSPDPQSLAPLQEDDEPRKLLAGLTNPVFNDVSTVESPTVQYERPSSRTSDLREQMSSLKGRISSLKERAREESLRRQSASQLRNSSPFNNALVSAPEFFYTSSSNYGSPVLDTNAGVGFTSNNESPKTPKSAQKPWDEDQARNSPPTIVEESLPTSPLRQTDPATEAPLEEERSPVQEQTSLETGTFLRGPTPIGTAMTNDDAEPQGLTRQHKHSSSLDMPGAFVNDDVVDSSSDTSRTSAPSSGYPGVSSEDDTPSEAGTSIYEDAVIDQSNVVAHEDRDDAFDYEHFFLHSSMARYEVSRRGSNSSGSSASSIETARGPRQMPAEQDEVEDEDEVDEVQEMITYDDEDDPDVFGHAGPGTPERLLAIERDLHKRAISSESLSTLNTFATADEGRWSFTEGAPPLLPPKTKSRPASRPGTAIRRPARRDSSSERADSGVGLSGRRSTGSDGALSSATATAPTSSARPAPLKTGARPATAGAVITSPPTSPRSTLLVRDPVSLAVQSLLHPDRPSLGLREKAILFGLVESLRSTVRVLQEGGEGEAQMEPAAVLEHRAAWRKKLEDARAVLDARPDSG